MNLYKLEDQVLIIAGKDKGKTGKIAKLLPKRNRVVVTGINMMKKCVKASQENPNGGIVDAEGSIHISNISHISPKTNGPTRVRIERDGKTGKRIATKCGSEI